MRKVMWLWVDALDWVVDRLNELVVVVSDFADDPLYEDERAE